MQLDNNFNSGNPSDPDTTEEIVSDLRIASKDQKWERWLSEQEIVRNWVGLNNFDPKAK